MEVILLERVEKLGQMGDLVSVKPGFARNFLLPKKKAVTATDENKIQFETQRVQLEARNLEQKTEAEKVGKKLEGQKFIMVRQAGDAGQLYGSVSARDISNEISKAGFSIDRNQVKLQGPIKSIGMHNMKITLHPEISVSVTINVARSNEEAQNQDKTGTITINDDIKSDSVEKLIEELDAAEVNMPSETEAEDQALAAKEMENTEEVLSEENLETTSNNKLEDITDEAE